MKKYLFLLVAILIPLTIQAQESIEIGNPLPEFNSFWELLGAVIDFIFYVSIPIAALLIVVSGYFFLASGGDPEKVRQAKHIIIYTLIGLIIIFLSKAMIAMLAERFGIDIEI